MSKTRRGRAPRRRDISVRAVRRRNADIKPMSRALINFALQQAAEEAAAEADKRRSGKPKR